jgi:hypothetical protein
MDLQVGLSGHTIDVLEIVILSDEPPTKSGGSDEAQ